MQHGNATGTTTGPEIELLMSRYQQVDPGAAAALVVMLSPQLYRFLAGKMGSRTDAEDMLQDVWLADSSRPPHVSAKRAVASVGLRDRRRVRVGNYRKRERIASRESAAEVLPEPPSQKNEVKTDLPAFEDLELPPCRRANARY
jgi:DNA-directed RNA polymerase specialized sigma24 family protein